MNNKDEEQQRKYYEEELKRVFNDFKIFFYNSDYLTQTFVMITLPFIILSVILFALSYAVFKIPLGLLRLFNRPNKK